MQKIIALVAFILFFGICRGQDIPVNSWTASNLKGRPKALYFVTYDCKKEKDKYIKIHPLVREDISFSEQGIETVFKSYASSNDSLLSIIINHFKNNGLASSTISDAKGEQKEKWIVIKTFKSYFATEAHCYSASNKFEKKVINSFNQNGGLIAQRIYNDHDSLLLELKYEYDQNNNLARKTIFRPKQVPEHYQYQYTKFDDKRNWTERIETGKNGQLRLTERKLVYY